MRPQSRDQAAAMLATLGGGENIAPASRATTGQTGERPPRADASQLTTTWPAVTTGPSAACRVNPAPPSSTENTLTRLTRPGDTVTAGEPLLSWA